MNGAGAMVFSEADPNCLGLQSLYHPQGSNSGKIKWSKATSETTGDGARPATMQITCNYMKSHSWIVRIAEDSFLLLLNGEQNDPRVTLWLRLEWKE